VGNPDIDAVHPWHSPYFKADEEAFPLGAALLALSALIACDKFIQAT